MKKKVIILIMMLVILLVFGNTVFSDGIPDMSPLRRLFGEVGVNSFHLEKFSMDSIDFDTLLRIVGSSSIDYSRLNYDAFLDILNDKEVLASLGVESIDRDALQSWLQDPATENKLSELMLTARQGGSFSAALQALSEDPSFLASFSAVTNGKDFPSVMSQLASGSAPEFLNKVATALLSPWSGAQSETVRTLSNLVQGASVTLGWKR